MPFECDVHLTKDGKVCVCHDSDLLRMTGKTGTIEELTLEEIQRDYLLPDGSSIMEFGDMLHLNEGKVPMVLELKAHEGNAKELAKAAVPIINAIPNVQDCYVISFSADALREAKKLGCIPPSDCSWARKWSNTALGRNSLSSISSMSRCTTPCSPGLDDIRKKAAP